MINYIVIQARSDNQVSGSVNEDLSCSVAADDLIFAHFHYNEDHNSTTVDLDHDGRSRTCDSPHRQCSLWWWRLWAHWHLFERLYFWKIPRNYHVQINCRDFSSCLNKLRIFGMYDWEINDRMKMCRLIKPNGSETRKSCRPGIPSLTNNVTTGCAVLKDMKLGFYMKKSFFNVIEI